MGIMTHIIPQWLSEVKCRNWIFFCCGVASLCHASEFTLYFPPLLWRIRVPQRQQFWVKVGNLTSPNVADPRLWVE